jgi:hypothetical protein
MTEPESRSLDILGVKPIADSVNRVTRAAVDGAAAFLSRICLPAAEELGLLFRDKVANWRATNAVAIVEGARERLERHGNTGPQLHAHPRIVGQIIDTGSWTDSDEVQDLWSGLLASSCSPDGKDESNLIFTNLLAQLTSLQAKVLTYACENATKALSPANWIYAQELRVDVELLRGITGNDDDYRLDRELDHLRALELIDGGFDFDTQRADITPTALALQLYVRCKGHRGDPRAFYGLLPTPPEASDADKDLSTQQQVTGKAKKRSTRKKSSTRKGSKE